MTVQIKDGWGPVGAGKVPWGRREYVPKDIAVTEDERMVEQVLKDRGLSGGCWDFVMCGRVPGRGMCEGYRTMPA